jgi:hypothetical protein|tara:strand:+ start:485 stop:1021 length:537 start_codon:yes stop_codon:yes gene_type:complete
MKNFIEKFAIPFYQTKIENWEEKKQKLLDIYDRFAQDNMNGAEQNSDFERDNSYHNLIEHILFDDIRKATREMVEDKRIHRLSNAWFQTYDLAHFHAIHNHGLGGLSMVCYMMYNPEHHRPTTFVCPFMSLDDGHILEWEPKGVEEGTLVMFPSQLAHYVPTNQSDVRRMILSANIEI